MEAGDLIYTLITLVFFIFLFMGPMLKKVNGKAVTGKPVKEDLPPDEDSMYESVDSHNVLDNLRGEHEIVHGETPEPEVAIIRSRKKEAAPVSGRERMERLAPLKQAVLWSEILSKPLSLRDPWEPGLR